MIPPLPVFGWQTFAGARTTQVPSVLDRGAAVFTSSGEAAIGLALECLNVGRGDRVLVPSYHCPTMIAPVVRAGAEPVFFTIDGQGLPDVQSIDDHVAKGARAMLVVHYFGFVQSLATVREFCTGWKIALIEDCAHAFFGAVDGQPAGTWGNYAIASLPKFFPVPEGGCLVLRESALSLKPLRTRSLRANAKMLWNAAEMSAKHYRMPGFDWVIRALASIQPRLRRRSSRVPGGNTGSDSNNTNASGAQPARAEALTSVAGWIFRHAHLARVVERRRENYLALAEAFRSCSRASALRPVLPSHCVPYVFPLRVENADPVYRTLRAARIPVFRWDDRWPTAPTLNDYGEEWSQSVLQLGCHQDISERDRAIMVDVIARALESAR